MAAGRQLPERMDSAAPYAATSGNRWERLCQALALPHLIDDPRLSNSPQRVANRDAMRSALSDTFRSQGTAHWGSPC